MACACKVAQHVQEIHSKYGSKPMVKTNIKEKINIFFKKMFIFLLCLPILPFIFLFLLIRKIVTNKPLSLKRFIKLNKHVRSK